jgi:predicted amidohydrolase
MRVAVAQFAAGADKAANRDRLVELVDKAAAERADLVVAPEAAMHGFGAADTPLAPVAEPLDGPFVTAVRDAAQQHGVTIVAGMFESVPEDSARAYNTVVAVGGDGVLVGAYRKLHLFDALGNVESQRLVPGPMAALTFDCAGLRVGVLTCYDLRFPELARTLVDDGATLLAVPAAWYAGPEKLDHWRVLTRARAIENTVFVAAAGQPPPECCGHSAVVDPYGVVLTELGEDDGDLGVADVDPQRIDVVRRRLPSLAHRRFRVVPRD